MTNERKKRPLDDTETEFGLRPGESSAQPPESEPELEVRLPDEAPDLDQTATSPDLLDDTSTNPGAIELDETPSKPEGEPFADQPDVLTRTDLHTGPLDPRVHDPATTDESRLLEVRLDPEVAHDEATQTSGLPEEPATETAYCNDETMTEFGSLRPAGPTGDEDEHAPKSDAPPTRTDILPGGDKALKSISKHPETIAAYDDDQTKTLYEEGPEDATADLSASVGGRVTARLHERPTIDFGDSDSNDEPETGSAHGPDFEVDHIEVPAATFVDTFFERRGEEVDEPTAPTRRSWRDRLERSKSATPWRDLFASIGGVIDPRPRWERLRETLRRRNKGDTPTNKEVAKAAAAAVASWARSVAKPRAEILAEHNKAWWRRTLTEIAALFLIVVPIELSVTGGSLGSFGFHPHPYWLIVLPMAAARGVVAGMIAGALASIFYTVGALQALPADQIGTLFDFENMREPILFFIVAFVIGELHDEMASRYKKLDRRHDDVQERNQSLRQERDVLRDANRELEKRIVDDSVQFGNLIVAAERIESSGRTEVFEIALELAEEHCGAAASVLLRLEDGSLDYLCHRGWSDEELSSRLTVARESEVVRLAIDEGRTINAYQPGEDVPREGPLVVAPLFDATGLVRALLCLDEIPDTRLNESTITVFLGISRWISSALTRLARNDGEARTAAHPESATDGSLWLGTADDLGERLRLELERCARYGVPTSFLAIQLSALTDTTAEGIEVADRFVAAHFTTGLRPSDNVYRFGYPGCYLLVLAGTAVSGAEIVRQRLLRRVDYAAAETIGPVEMFTTGPDAEAPDLVSLVERVAGRLRATSALALKGACPVKVPTSIDTGSSAALVHRMRLEVGLALRYGFDFNAIAIGTGSDSLGAIETLARHLAEAGARLLRLTDGIYRISRNRIAVVMPSTGSEEAAALAHRLVQALRERDAEARYGDLETRVISLGATNPDAREMLLALGYDFSTEDLA